MPDPLVSALYYPHTMVRTKPLMKTALLLWDHVDCIVPSHKIERAPMGRYMTEAAELVITPHVPSEVAKQRVHDRLLSLLADGVPSPDFSPELGSPLS